MNLVDSSLGVIPSRNSISEIADDSNNGDYVSHLFASAKIGINILNLLTKLSKENI